MQCQLFKLLQSVLVLARKHYEAVVHEHEGIILHGFNEYTKLTVQINTS